MSESRPALRNAIQSVIDTMRAEIALEHDDWISILRYRTSCMEKFYGAVEQLFKLDAEEANNQARIFRIPFASAKMFYQLKNGPLYYCKDITVETIGALTFLKDGELVMVNKTGLFKFKVLNEYPEYVELALADPDEEGEDIIGFGIDIARAVCSTFKIPPENTDPATLSVGVEQGFHPTFNHSIWIKE